VALTQPNNLLAVSLTPVNSYSAVSLTPAKIFMFFGYPREKEKIQNGPNGILGGLGDTDS
jgi:hypothetical protein